MESIVLLETSNAEFNRREITEPELVWYGTFEYTRLVWYWVLSKLLLLLLHFEAQQQTQPDKLLAATF
jgi:hypothetical protein